MAYTPSCMHACMHMALLQALSILLFASMLVPAGSAEEAPSGYHVDLIHVDANGGFTREELIRRAVDRTHLRAAMLSATHSHELTLMEGDRGHYVYLMELKIGEHRQPFRAVADTGSGLVWTTQLELCKSSASKTFTHVPPCSDSCRDLPGKCKSLCNSCPDGLCVFNKTYGHGLMGQSWAKGFMGNDKLDFSDFGCVIDINAMHSVSKSGNEKLTLSDDNEKFIDFGCVIDINAMHHVSKSGADGIVGLDRGPESLVKQLEFTKFSYCLSNQSEPERPGQLSFGNHVPALSNGWSSTPLVSTTVRTNKYAVELDGISIGANAMYRIQKEHFKYESIKNGKGVMFLDSGSSRTIFPPTVFDELKKLLERELGKSIPKYKSKEKLTCFKAPSSKWPDMVLHFTGAEMHLPWTNYMVEFEPKSEFSCLAIKAHKGLWILGNFQQQNIHMLYDLTKGNEKLSFVRRESCSTLL